MTTDTAPPLSPEEETVQWLRWALHNEIIDCKWSEEEEYNACPGPDHHKNQVALLLRALRVKGVTLTVLRTTDTPSLDVERVALLEQTMLATGASLKHLSESAMTDPDRTFGRGIEWSWSAWDVVLSRAVDLLEALGTDRAQELLAPSKPEPEP